MKRLLFCVLFLFLLNSICSAQQESLLSIKNKISGNPSHEKYATVDEWIVKRLSVSEKLGISSFDSILTFMPDVYKIDAGRYVLDYLEGGLSEKTQKIILDSIYNFAVRIDDIRGQCDLLRYFNGSKLGSYKAELDSVYRLAEKYTPNYIL